MKQRVRRAVRETNLGKEEDTYLITCLIRFHCCRWHGSILGPLFRSSRYCRNEGRGQAEQVLTRPPIKSNPAIRNANNLPSPSPLLWWGKAGREAWFIQNSYSGVGNLLQPWAPLCGACPLRVQASHLLGSPYGSWTFSSSHHTSIDHFLSLCLTL